EGVDEQRAAEGATFHAHRAIVLDSDGVCPEGIELRSTGEERGPGDGAVPEELLEGRAAATPRRLEQRDVTDMCAVDPRWVARQGCLPEQAAVLDIERHCARRGHAVCEQGQAKHDRR